MPVNKPRIVKATLKDARPEVGIFEVVDGVFFYASSPADPVYAVGGTVDGGHLFHRDLMKEYAYKNPNISEESKAKIAKNGFQNWRAFPRGRVYYSVPEDKYYVTLHPSLYNPQTRNDIINSFRLPRNKIVWTTDPEYSELSE